MKIFADKTVCVGAGQCALTAPTLFDQDDDGLVEVLNAEPVGSEEEAAAGTAEQVCPSMAIRLRD
jgi:ferredoxin